jgi:serine/threonine-protein kinase HipA
MTFRTATVKVKNQSAGILAETEAGYNFQYDPEYLKTTNAEPVSLTLPLQVEPYTSKVLFPFFDGLIPEGWLLTVVEKTWKLNPRDRMGLLLSCCKDCIGDVSVIPEGNPDEKAG